MNYPNVRGEYRVAPIRTITTDGAPAEVYPPQVAIGDILVVNGAFQEVQRILTNRPAGGALEYHFACPAGIFMFPLSSLVKVFPAKAPAPRDRMTLYAYQLRPGDQVEGMGIEGEILENIEIPGPDVQITFVNGVVETWNRQAVTPTFRLNPYTGQQVAFSISDYSEQLIQKAQAQVAVEREISATERQSISDVHLARRGRVPEVRSWDELERVVHQENDEYDTKLDVLEDGTIFVVPVEIWAKYLAAKDAGDGMMMTAHACMVVDSDGRLRKNRYGRTS